MTSGAGDCLRFCVFREGVSGRSEEGVAPAVCARMFGFVPHHELHASCARGYCRGWKGNIWLGHDADLGEDCSEVLSIFRPGWEIETPRRLACFQFRSKFTWGQFSKRLVRPLRIVLDSPVLDNFFSLLYARKPILA